MIVDVSDCDGENVAGDNMVEKGGEGGGSNWGEYAYCLLKAPHMQSWYLLGSKKFLCSTRQGN